VKRARCFPPPLLNQVVEFYPMVDANELSQGGLPLTRHPSALEVLERLRDSYKGLSDCRVLTGADQAVQAAVENTLNHLAKAS
jgi:hypothetical protein